MKIPLRANTVTGTKKFLHCFANTEEARRAQINQDGRYMTGTVSEPWSRGPATHKRAREATEDLYEVSSERRKGFIKGIDYGGEVLGMGKAVVLFAR